MFTSRSWPVLCIVLATSTIARSATQQPPSVNATPSVPMYMPDGQLRSHRLRVYVPTTILPNQNPRLTLLRSHAGTEKQAAEETPLTPTLVAPDQDWVETIDDTDVRRSGTLLLFDASEVPFGVRPMVRVLPALQWTENGIERWSVNQTEVNVADIVWTIIWTLLATGAALLVIIALARRDGGSAVQLLTGVDGHLSLAQTQMACWTFVVGCIVLGYGIVRLTVPDIPGSLLVLMGTSLMTGGLAYFGDSQKQQAQIEAGGPVVLRTWRWSDLIRSFTPGQPPELSLAKAQMLFWTVVLLVMFVSKSILDGAIWEVPWPLVALMGVSQAGYLAPKLAPATQGS